LFFKVNGKAAELNNKKRKDINVRYIEVPEVRSWLGFVDNFRSIVNYIGVFIDRFNDELRS
jgi:hypothetical protein